MSILKHAPTLRRLPPDVSRIQNTLATQLTSGLSISRTRLMKAGDGGDRWVVFQKMRKHKESCLTDGEMYPLLWSGGERAPVISDAASVC